MSSPSAFEIGRNVGNNLGNAFAKVKDENAIERILSDAMGSGDPEVLQNSIGKILSQVSPERQGVAMQYLQNAYSNVQKRQDQSKIEARDKAAAQEAGYTYGAPPQVQGQQVKDRAKEGRLSSYGLGAQPGQQQPGGQMGQPGQMQPALAGNPAQPAAGQPPQGAPQQPKQIGNVLEAMDDQQLRLLTGHPDREVSEPAKAILKGRDEERNLNQKKNDNWTKFGMERAKKVLDKAEDISHTLPVKKTALKLMVDSIANQDLSFWTPDNLAEVTGIEAFRTMEGALFKTAAKEYFLGSIARAGARPNQWIEQQISDMLTKIGRSRGANLSVSRALQNELDIDEERVRLTEEIFSDLRSQEKDIGDLGPMVNSRLAKFAEQKQNELFNDLRAIKAIEEGKTQKFHKVAQGTQVSPYMVDALLNAFNNDPEKALQEAKKLGYSVE